MPRPLVLLVNPSLLLFGFLLLFTLFPVRSLAQSPSITDVRNSNNGVDYTGAIGQDVKINGSNFGSSQGSSTVAFNGTAATVTTWNATSIYTTVPSGAASGDLVVTVGGVASNAVSFTVIAGPNVVTLRNAINANDFTGAVGQSVKIVGGGFGASQGSSTITFNGTTATATSWAANAIYTAVPSGATSGNLVVTVGGVASNTVSFSVIAGPNILTVRHNNVDVTSGIVGDALKIMGGGFGTSQGSSTITLNGTTATATTWGADAVYTTVPSGATSGNLIVTVGGTASNTYSFTVLPVITSVSPSTGTVGTSVTITGSSFGATQGTSTVQINGASATASSWSDTSIGVTVPSGATPQGNVYVTVSGVTSNGVSFQANPYISSANPTLVSTGTAVTISGSSFGATQGTSTVSFNGTAGTPTSWSNTQIMVPVPSGATSGNLTVTVGGQQSNGVSFTIVDPPSITTSVWPAANGAGWHNANVAVTHICTPGDLVLASCSDPQTFSSEGQDYLATGEAEDVNGNTATTTVTLDIDKTKPTLTITSPEDGDSTSSSSITVSGTLSDTLSGTSSVTCNGTSTTLSGNSFSCNVSLNMGLNLIVIQGTDVAGNISAANFHVTRTGTLDTPTTLRITPSEVNMVVGGTQQFSVVDDDGRPRTDATWQVSDTNIATVPDANTPELTAVDEGDVTLTATIGSVTAEADVHVLAGTSLTDGTVRWSSPAGYTAQRIVQAIPFRDSPELLSIEKFEFGEDDAVIFVRGMTSDGRQLWVNSVLSGDDVPGYQVLGLPDNDGGIVTYFKTPYQVFNWLARLDAKTGQGVWDTSGSVPYDNLNPRFALGLDYVYFTEHWPTSDWRGAAVGDVLYSVDLLSGQVKPVYSAIRLRYYCGTGWTHGQSRLSDPIIDSDGSVLAVLSVTQAPSCNFDAKLYLLRIAPDGSTTLTQFRQLSTSANGLVDPRQLIPDGQGEGGVLVSWDDTDLITRVTTSGASDFDLGIVAGIQEMILGENDVAYATDHFKLVAFNATSGQTIWSYNAPQGSTVSMIASATEEGLAAKVTTSGVEMVVRFDSEGTPTLDSWTGKNVEYDLSASWIGVSSSNQLVSFAGALIDWAKSIWSAPGQQGTNRPVAKVTLRVAVIKDAQGANVAGSTQIQDVVDTAVSYWQKRARILLDWNDEIESLQACQGTCSPNIQTDPTSMFDPVFDQGTNNITVQTARARFGSPTGIQVVFVHAGYGVGPTAFNGYTMYHIGNDEQIFENVVFLTSVGSHMASGQQFAHEIGHTFQLPHVPYSAFNLMCGPISGSWVDWLESFPCTELSLSLNERQIRNAQAGAKAWESH